MKLLGLDLMLSLPSVGRWEGDIVVVTGVGRVAAGWEVELFLVGTVDSGVGGREPWPYLAWHSG